MAYGQVPNMNVSMPTMAQEPSQARMQTASYPEHSYAQVPGYAPLPSTVSPVMRSEAPLFVGEHVYSPQSPIVYATEGLGKIKFKPFKALKTVGTAMLAVAAPPTLLVTTKKGRKAAKPAAAILTGGVSLLPSIAKKKKKLKKAQPAPVVAKTPSVHAAFRKTGGFWGNLQKKAAAAAAAPAAAVTAAVVPEPVVATDSGMSTGTIALIVGAGVLAIGGVAYAITSAKAAPAVSRNRSRCRFC